MKCKNIDNCGHFKNFTDCKGCYIDSIINGNEDEVYIERFRLCYNDSKMHREYLKGKWDEGFSFIDFCHLKATQDIKNIKEYIEE